MLKQLCHENVEQAQVWCLDDWLALVKRMHKKTETLPHHVQAPRVQETQDSVIFCCLLCSTLFPDPTMIVLATQLAICTVDCELKVPMSH